MSLRDQLLKAGVADKKKVDKVNRDLKKQRKQEQAQRERQSVLEAREQQARDAAEAERRARIAEDRARIARLRELQARQRLVRDIVSTYRLVERSGPVSFWHRAPNGRTLLRLRLPESWADDLRVGRLAIVWTGPSTQVFDISVVPAHAATRIAAHEPARILFQNPGPPEVDDPAEALYGAFGEAAAATVPPPRPGAIYNPPRFREF